MKDQNTTISGPSLGPPAKRHLNGISLACRWWHYIECWLGSFVAFKGIRTSIAKKPFIFVIFQGGGGLDSLSSPLDPHMRVVRLNRLSWLLFVSACSGSCPPSWIARAQGYTGILTANSPMCRFRYIMTSCDQPNTQNQCRPGFSCCPVSCLQAIKACNTDPALKNMCIPDDVTRKLTKILFTFIAAWSSANCKPDKDKALFEHSDT